MKHDIFTRLKALAISGTGNIVSDRFDVVTTASQIAALSAKMTKELDALVTILWETDSGDLDRDDLYSVSGKGRTTCRLFRDFTKENGSANGKFCDLCDKYHYFLLKSYVEGGQNKISAKPDFFPPKYENPPLKSIDCHVTGEKTEYIEYVCPMLGYTELLFAIRVDNIFLGALFIGQILKESDDEAQATFENFLEYYSDAIEGNPDESHVNAPQAIFGRWLRKKQAPASSRVDFLRVVRAYETGHEPISGTNEMILCLTNHVNVIKNDAYEMFIGKSIEQVKELSRDLQGIIDKRRENLIRDTLKNICHETLDNYFKDEREHLLFGDMVDYYEKVLRKTFVEGLREFGVGNIRVLGLDKDFIPIIDEEEKNKMKLVMSTVKGERDDDFVLTLSNIENISKDIAPKHPSEPTESLESEVFNKTYLVEYEKSIFALLCEESRDVSREPLKFIISRECYMFLLYDEWFVLIEVSEVFQNRRLYSMLLTNLVRHMTSFISKYETRLLKFISKRHLLTMLLYRHECIKIATAISSKNEQGYRKIVNGLDKIRNKYFDMVETYDSNVSGGITYSFKDGDEIQENFFEDAKIYFTTGNNKNVLSSCDDIRENAELIVHMADTIGIIIGRINSQTLNSRPYKPEAFDLSKSIVLKWVQASRVDLTTRQQHLALVINNMARNYSDIYQIKRLIDITVYNLFDNALKYSHWGTKVFITIGNETSFNSPDIPIKIVNYGSYISEYPKAFEIFYRGDKSTHIEGDGLGLYVVKTISDMLGFDIKYTCEGPISDYNVGLIGEYIKEGKDKELIKELIKEREKLAGWLDKVVNYKTPTPVSSLPYSSAYLEKYINKSTYQVTFELTVQKSTSGL